MAGSRYRYQNPYAAATPIGAALGAIANAMWASDAQRQSARDYEAMAMEDRMRAAQAAATADRQAAEAEALRAAEQRRRDAPDAVTAAIIGPQNMAAYRAMLQRGGPEVPGAWGTSDTGNMTAIEPAPRWYSPATQRAISAAQLAIAFGNAGTGNSQADDLARAASTIGEEQNVGQVIAGTLNPMLLAQAQMARKGGAPFANMGTAGVYSPYTGAQNLNEIGTSAAAENRAQAGAHGALAMERGTASDLNTARTGLVNAETENVRAGTGRGGVGGTGRQPRLIDVEEVGPDGIKRTIRAPDEAGVTRKEGKPSAPPLSVLQDAEAFVSTTLPGNPEWPSVKSGAYASGTGPKISPQYAAMFRREWMRQYQALGGDSNPNAGREAATAALQAVPIKGQNHRYFGLGDPREFVPQPSPGGQAQPQATPAAAPAAAPAGVPPAAQRRIGQVYQTPRGPMQWNGRAWVEPGT
jgi:hypothetical protein